MGSAVWLMRLIPAAGQSTSSNGRKRSVIFPEEADNQALIRMVANGIVEIRERLLAGRSVAGSASVCYILW